MFPPHAQHGNAGRTPANRTSDKTVARLVEIIEKYTRTDPTRGFLSCCNPNFAGPAGLLRAMAQEATEEYESIHEITAQRILREYIRRCVGEQRRCTQLGRASHGTHAPPRASLCAPVHGDKNPCAGARAERDARSFARSLSLSLSLACGALSLSGGLSLVSGLRCVDRASPRPSKEGCRDHVQ